jgi:hypothetical protein
MKTKFNPNQLDLFLDNDTRTVAKTCEINACVREYNVPENKIDTIDNMFLYGVKTIAYRLRYMSVNEAMALLPLYKDKRLRRASDYHRGVFAMLCSFIDKFFV